MAGADAFGEDGASGSISNRISGGVFFHTVIQGRDITVQLPPEVTPALSALPAGSSEFMGRETELSVLLDVLDPSSTGRTALSVVTGLPGVGKTELAVQAVRAAQHRGWCPGGVLFVDLHGYDGPRRLTPGQALDGILRALGVPAEHIPPRPDDRSRLYASILTAYARDGQALAVVLDNASSVEQVRLLLPVDDRTRAIVTSRNSLATLDARLLDLDLLDEETSVGLLAGILRRARGTDYRTVRDPQTACAIARLCGYLPLALRIVGALLAEEPSRPLAELARDLEDERARLAELEVEDLSIRSAFDLSYRSLTGPVAEMFRLLALHHGPDISTEAAAVLGHTDERESRRVLDSLARAHLLHHGDTRGRWRLHDLVRLFSSERLASDTPPEQRKAAGVRLVTFYLNGIRRAADILRLDSPVMRDEEIYFDPRSDPDDTATQRFWEHFRSTARMAVEVLREQMPDLLPSRDGAGSDPERLLRRDSLGEARRSEVAGVLTWLESERANLLATAAHTTLSNEGVGLTGLLASLASLLRDVAEAMRWDSEIGAMASEAHWQAAALHRGLADQRAEAVHLNNSAVMAERPGRQSLERQARAVELFEELGDLVAHAKALANLGTALHLLGHYEGAAAARRLAADKFHQAGSPNGLGEQLVQRGVSLRAAGRIEDAVDAFGLAVSVFESNRSLQGEDYALEALAELLDGVTEPALAASVLGKATDIFGRAGEVYKQGFALINLGLALRHLGRHDEAATTLRRADKFLVRFVDATWAAELSERVRRLLADPTPATGQDWWAQRHHFAHRRRP
ncbi:AAA family ATPase [Streptomyces sp. NPDC056244]|uniref:AAA family ATPase n=1 Tax=Streptomyces sp. NPDC056244 TaxID=3345762 RepID=UPI0035D5DBF7